MDLFRAELCALELFVRSRPRRYDLLWMNAQRAVDLYDVAKRIQGDIGRIKPLGVA